jgi:hypothetical protein
MWAGHRVTDGKIWLSRDPSGEGSDPNLYRLYAGDPINLSDPSGLDTTLTFDKQHFYRINGQGYEFIGGKAYPTTRFDIKTYEGLDTLITFEEGHQPGFGYQPSTTGRVIGSNVINQIGAGLDDFQTLHIEAPGFTEDPAATAIIQDRINDKNAAVSAPGRIESKIPIWGSGRAALHDFTAGHWGWGLFNTALAVSDVFLVKSIASIPLKASLREAAAEVTEQEARELGQQASRLRYVVDDAGQEMTIANDKRGWSVGEPINNLTSRGDVPSWSTVRQRFWKNEALNNSAEYDAEALARMQKGLAPQRANKLTGEIESMELHHTPAQRTGGLFNMEPVWPDEHAVIDPSRKTPG